MPYLDHDWMIGTQVLAAGTWVPERNWDRWQGRASNVDAAQLSWRQSGQPTSDAGVHSVKPSPPEHYLGVLAGDIVSAQRDALIYSNLIERLKNSPDDATADAVVDQMQTLGFASANWPEAVGGPPPHQSPRPWRRVLDWLLQLSGKVFDFLIKCIESAGSTLAIVGVSAVAVGLSWSPELSFEFPTEMFRNNDEWQKARTFLGSMATELRQQVFST